ncbi:aldehyde dehydrogenase family protein, partial [Pseudomonas viridiflava]|uniref:aldehyde dehydrogenase family protein n=1 Tax=Pseudomonas viridiflava TaxID=33069 RepID=UPI001F07C180
NADELALLETLDMGKPISDSLGVDIPGAANALSWSGEAIDKLYDEVAATPHDQLGLVTREPVGVVAAIVPWNFPLVTSAWKLAPALAAGCTVILKPSEITPLVELAYAQIAQHVGLPTGVLNIVNGKADTGAALSDHAGLDKLSFTGSNAVGVQVMRNSAAYCRPVTLELGGKSAFIVFDDCDPDQAVEWIVAGICWNTGQMCSATSRL